MWHMFIITKFQAHCLINSKSSEKKNYGMTFKKNSNGTNYRSRCYIEINKNQNTKLEKIFPFVCTQLWYIYENIIHTLSYRLYKTIYLYAHMCTNTYMRIAEKLLTRQRRIHMDYITYPSIP